MARVREIRVCAVVLRNEAGLVVTVRKWGTSRFMLPGGKPEAGEDPRETAVRECREELGIELAPGNLTFLGSFRAAAANEPNADVAGQIFEHPVIGEVSPSSEIAEVRWLDVSVRPLPRDLAPMLSEHVVPSITARSS